MKAASTVLMAYAVDPKTCVVNRRDHRTSYTRPVAPDATNRTTTTVSMAVGRGAISVTPLSLELTHGGTLKALRKVLD